MPNYTLTPAELKKRGYLIKVQGNQDYLTVAGTVFLAHDSELILGIELTYDVTDTHIEVLASAKILNEAAIKKIQAYKLDKDAENALISQVGVGTFDGTARSPIKGGKMAEATNPFEVAATSAIGRALRAAGFGEMESFATADEVLVAIGRRSGDSNGDDEEVTVTTNPPTEKQVAAAQAMLNDKLGLTTEEQIDQEMQDRFGKDFDELTKADMSTLIGALKKMRKTPKKEAKPGFKVGT